MTSSMVALSLLIGKVGEFVFFDGYQRVVGHVRVRDESKPVLLDGLERLIPTGPGDLCAFVMKDIRIFPARPRAVVTVLNILWVARSVLYQHSQFWLRRAVQGMAQSDCLSKSLQFVRGDVFRSPPVLPTRN